MSKNEKIGLFVGSVFLAGAVILIFMKKNKAKTEIYTPVSVATAGGAFNNAGNIRKGNDWKGEKTPEIAGAFESFENLAYGYRALIKLLRNYYLAGFHDLNAVINHYAPAADNNNPAAYINFVVNYTGISKTQDLKDIVNSEKIYPLLKAISLVEQGTSFKLDENSIKEAFRMLS